MTVVAEPPALSIAHLSKTYPGTAALRDVSLEVARGELHALVGANGSGKSTLVKVVAGVVRGDRGGLVAAGPSRVDSDRTTPEWARNAGVRFVHQDLALFPHLTVAENIAIGNGFDVTRFHRIRWRAVRARTRALLQHFGIASDPDTPVSRLGSADRAMVAIARALQDDAHDDTRLLVFDEPTAALPEPDSARLLASLRALASQGRGVLVVSHRIAELLAAADSVTVLRDGRVAGTQTRPRMTERGVAELIAGPARVPRAPARRRAHGEHDVRLDVDRLTGRAIRGVTFAVRGSETLGLAGLPDSGCSELLQIVFGARPMQSGTVRVDGRVARPRDIGDAMRAGIAYVPEDRSDATFPDLSMSDNVAAATVSSYWRRGLLRTHDEELDAVGAMERLSIRARGPRQPMWTLSGGNQQKVVLARWLRRRPSVLLLDDPTRGVDANARAQIAVALADAQAAGTAIVLVSSDLDELCELSDRVIVLVRGTVVAELPRALLDPRRVARLAYGSASSHG